MLGPYRSGTDCRAATVRERRFFATLILLAGICSGQSRPHYVEIKLPPAVASESFFVRYVLAGEDFGAWVQPLIGVSSYVISTVLDCQPATGIRLPSSEKYLAGGHTNPFRPSLRPGSYLASQVRCSLGAGVPGA